MTWKIHGVIPSRLALTEMVSFTATWKISFNGWSNEKEKITLVEWHFYFEFQRLLKIHSPGRPVGGPDQDTSEVSSVQTHCYIKAVIAPFNELIFSWFPKSKHLRQRISFQSFIIGLILVLYKEQVLFFLQIKKNIKNNGTPRWIKWVVHEIFNKVEID